MSGPHVTQWEGVLRYEYYLDLLVANKDWFEKKCVLNRLAMLTDWSWVKLFMSVRSRTTSCLVSSSLYDLAVECICQLFVHT